MSDNAATPAENNDGNPPVAPAAAPAESQGGQFVLTFKTKEDMDEFARNAGRASEAQSRADRFEGVLKRHGLLPGSKTILKPQPSVTPPSPEEQEAAAGEEDRKASQGLMILAVDPAYREVLDKDPTLRQILIGNPLALLPIYAPNALDAEDAIGLVKEALNQKVAESKPKGEPPPSSEPSPTPPSPGAVNPPTSDVPDTEYEEAKKNPSTEGAIAGMVKAKLKKSGALK